MSRRVSKIAATALFALVLTLSTPSAFAAQSRDGGDPDFGTRIIRVLKNIAHHFGFHTWTNDEQLSPPKP